MKVREQRVRMLAEGIATGSCENPHGVPVVSEGHESGGRIILPGAVIAASEIDWYATR